LLADITKERTTIPPLTAEGEVAVLARALFREGYDDHNLGHVTVRQEDETFLTLPFHLGWEEVRRSDVIRIDIEGNVISGDGAVTPGIMLHLALHRARPDTGVAVHHHPRYGTVYAMARRVPSAYDQTSAMVYDSDIALYDDFPGAVSAEEIAARNIEAIGNRNLALLANHGVMVLAEDIRQAFCRAVILEWRCRQAWMVEAVGGGVPMPADGNDAIVKLIRGFDERQPYQWEWAVRRELRHDPCVLQ